MLIYLFENVEMFFRASKKPIPFDKAPISMSVLPVKNTGPEHEPPMPDYLAISLH